MHTPFGAPKPGVRSGSTGLRSNSSILVSTDQTGQADLTITAQDSVIFALETGSNSPF